MFWYTQPGRKSLICNLVMFHHTTRGDVRGMPPSAATSGGRDLTSLFFAMPKFNEFNIVAA
jgi:hypothetical protein